MRCEDFVFCVTGEGLSLVLNPRDEPEGRSGHVALVGQPVWGRGVDRDPIDGPVDDWGWGSTNNLKESE